MSYVFSAIICLPVLNGVLHAERMALWFGIRMALKEGFQRLVVERGLSTVSALKYAFDTLRII